MSEKIAYLASRIVEILQSGIFLGENVAHFMNSTFSNPTLEKIEAIVHDASSSEKDAFIELLFFPDEHFQIQIEDILLNNAFTEDDEKKLIQSIRSKEPEARFFIPGFVKPISLKMPSWAAEGFISRLNILRHLPNKLAKAIEREVDKKARQIVRVRLRNSNVEYTEDNIGFMSAFFKNMTPVDPGFFKCFDFILLFFSENINSLDLYADLMNKKRSLKEDIRKGLSFESALRENNIETLMMQGKRNPCIHVQDLEEKVRLIESISLAVYGR